MKELGADRRRPVPDCGLGLDRYRKPVPQQTPGIRPGTGGDTGVLSAHNSSNPYFSPNYPLILRIRARGVYGARGSNWDLLNIVIRLLGTDRRSPKEGVARHRRQN